MELHPTVLRNKFRMMHNGNFGSGQGSSSFQNRSFGRIWYFDDKGKLQMARAVLGLTDGKNTEIVRSRDLKEGMKVITGQQNADENGTSNISNRNFPRGLGEDFKLENGIE